MQLHDADSRADPLPRTIFSTMCAKRKDLSCSELKLRTRCHPTFSGENRLPLAAQIVMVKARQTATCFPEPW